VSQINPFVNIENETAAELPRRPARPRERTPKTHFKSYRPNPAALWLRQSGMMLTCRLPQLVQTKRRRSAIEGKGA